MPIDEKPSGPVTAPIRDKNPNLDRPHQPCSNIGLLLLSGVRERDFVEALGIPFCGNANQQKHFSQSVTSFKFFVPDYEDLIPVTEQEADIFNDYVGSKWMVVWQNRNEPNRTEISEKIKTELLGWINNDD